MNNSSDFTIQPKCWLKGGNIKPTSLLCLNSKNTMRSKNIQHCSTPYYYLQQTLNKSFIITVFLMPLDCRNQLTGTGRAEWCLLIYWGLFVVTNICSGFVTSTTGAPGSVWAWHELLSPTPGQWMARGGGSVFTNYRGEGVMTVMRMRLGLDVTRCSRLTPQWWLHN